MPALTLYHWPHCAFSRRTRFLLELLGVRYDPVEVDPGDVPEPYRLISPRGIVPAIVHDDRGIYGSEVINEYLDRRFGGGLMPEDAVAQAEVRMLVREADMEFLPVLNGLQWALRDGADIGLTATLRRQAAERVERFEGLFAGDWLFVGGPELTLADLAFASTIPHLVEPAYGVDVPEDLERTHEWIAAMRTTPEWIEVAQTTTVKAPARADPLLLR